jgi:hypothetical protein
MRMWWHRFQCWRDSHQYVVYYVGHNAGKECLWCHAHGVMTEEEFIETQKSQFNSWGNDVVEEEDERDTTGS